MERIRPGLTGEATVLVDETMTAASEGNDDIQVLSTSQLLRLMEVAAGSAVFHVLPPGFGIVGVESHLRHLAPTPVGFTVTARAEVTGVEGNRIQLRIEVFDRVEKVGEADHTLAVVELARIRRRWQAKAGHE